MLRPAQVDAALDQLWRLEQCGPIASLLDLFTV
jgi:hypothetical protein